MAQKVSVTYVCDYDQKEIPQGEHRLRVSLRAHPALYPMPGADRRTLARAVGAASREHLPRAYARTRAGAA